MSDSDDDVLRAEDATARIEIERWWPHLSIEAKHRLLQDLEAELDEEAIAEIVVIAARSGRPDAEPPVRLAPHERDYVRTQIEAVD